MQDRLKFRYFNKYANKMVEPKNWQNVDGTYECIKQQVCFDEDIQPIPYDHIGRNGLVFMQCTGLKDKNGKLIYEGDILRNTLTNKYASVAWHNTGAGYVWSKTIPNSYLYEFGALFRVFGKYEVIGNIYENPELLEQL